MKASTEPVIDRIVEYGSLYFAFRLRASHSAACRVPSAISGSINPRNVNQRRLHALTQSRSSFLLVFSRYCRDSLFRNGSLVTVYPTINASFAFFSRDVCVSLPTSESTVRLSTEPLRNCRCAEKPFDYVRPRNKNFLANSVNRVKRRGGTVGCSLYD